MPPVHLASSKWNPAIPLGLRRLLQRESVDILHTHGVPSCWLGQRAYVRGLVPYLVQHVHHMYQGQHGQSLQNMLERRVYQRGNRLVGCSQAVVDSVKTSLPTTVIYNGVDTAQFSPPTATQREAARQRFGFSSQDHVLCMTGRITRQKGVLAVCEALAALAKTYPTLRLLVAGQGPDEALVRHFCSEAGIDARVVMPGFLEDVCPCLHAADTYVMASEVEGLGTALLEAMSTGLSAIVADYPAAREIAEEGSGSTLFRRSAPNALENAVAETLSQPSGDVSPRAVVLERFSIERTVQSFLEAYKKIDSR